MKKAGLASEACRQAIKNRLKRITAEMIAGWKPSTYERTLVS